MAECLNCRFYEPLRIQNMGSCRRYPTVVSTTPNGWCGEFAEGVRKVELIAQPVLEPMAVVENVIKRRGRPPKGGR